MNIGVLQQYSFIIQMLLVNGWSPPSAHCCTLLLPITWNLLRRYLLLFPKMLISMSVRYRRWLGICLPKYSPQKVVATLRDC